MSVFEAYGKEIIALSVPVITWLLNTVFKARAKLMLSNTHRFKFLVQQPLLDSQGDVISPTQSIDTCSFVLINVGKDTATNVELVFNWKPLLNIWPSRHVTEHIEPDGRYVLIFESLAPNEFIGCEMVEINGDLPMIITARSDQCVAQTIEMSPQPVISNWKRRTAVFLLLAGMALIVYLLILLIQFLVLRTPLGH